MSLRLHRFTDQHALVEHLSTATATLANQCIRQRERFSIVLAGGNTPRQLYRRLRTIDTDWYRWHVYFGDERCLPVGHPDRNDSMATEAWLGHVPIPSKQLNPLPFADCARTAATAYAQILADTPQFDLVLLGLGEDGHTASLFPGAAHAGNAATVAVEDAPKPPRQRVSMSAERLSRADAVWFLVAGESKREALEAWLAGADLPAATIRPAAGIDVFTDLTEGIDLSDSPALTAPHQRNP